MLQYLFNSTALTYLYSVNRFVGSSRNDWVWSSNLNDTISTGDGNDYVDSGGGNDVISLGNGNDTAYAGNGDDTVDGGAGKDSLFGGNGNDSLSGGIGDDFIDGGAGNDSINGGAGADRIEAGAGNDIIRGGDGDDRIDAGSGNDQVIYRADATAGRDRVNGGQGTDTLVLELTAAQQANPAFVAERAAFATYLANGGTGTFTFQSIGLTVTGGFEQLNVVTVGGPPVNTAPVVSGAVTLPAGTEDTAITITTAQLLANATDAEGNPLSVVNLTATNGAIVNNGNGTWTFTPTANFNGVVNLSYGVSDGLLTTAATATVALTAVNDGPVNTGAVTLPAAAEDSSVTITAAQLLGNASDVDSATLSVVGLTASSGTLVDNGNGTWTFTPDANDDGEVSFTYQINDGTASVGGTATLDLTAVNDGPTAGAPVVLAPLAEDTSVTITAAQLLANASDIDGDALSVSGVSASSGTLVDNGDGTWTFTPDANDNSGVTFTYSISDGTASVAGTATLDLTAVNDGPTAGAPIVLAPLAEDTSVTITTAQLLANASDVDGDTLSVVGLVASSGTLVNNEDGTWTFTPAANDNTGVTFTYTISDGVAEVAGSASLDLTPVNDSPVAGAPIVLAPLAEDTTVVITAAQLLANASDIDGDALAVSAVSASSGTLVANGNGTWSFTPALNDNSAVTFTVTLTDGTESVVTTATLDLTPVNDAPVAGPTVVLPAANEDTEVTITAAQLLGTASDVDGDTLTIVNLVASSGTVALNENGTWTFTPDANDDTAVTFTYEIDDGTVTVAGEATLDLLPVNDLPVVDVEGSNLNVEIFRGGNFFGSIIATDVETPQNELTYELYFGNEVAPLGTVYLNPDGTYEYYPPVSGENEVEISDYVGPDSFQVLVRDADGGETIVTVNIDVVVDPGSVNYINGNGNADGDVLQGTIAPDLFVFENYGQFEVTSGLDVIENFTQGADLIELQGESFTADDILASVFYNEAENTYTYSIAATGAQIVTSVELTVDDIRRNVWGTDQDDVQVGGSGVDWLNGNEGDDTLDAGAGNDLLYGGSGSDTMTGGAGADRFEIFIDQPGNDVITDFVSGEDTLYLYHDVIEPDPSAFLATGVANGDGSYTYQLGSLTSFTVNTQLTLDDINLVYGATGRTTVNGTAADDVNLTGTIFGDTIVGLGGNDTILGFGGDDWIDGGSGNDILTGGAGSDTFVLTENNTGNDIITDFDVLMDSIALDASTTREDFIASEVDNDGSFTYSLADGSSFTTGVQLNIWNVYNLFPV